MKKIFLLILFCSITFFSFSQKEETIDEMATKEAAEILVKPILAPIILKDEAISKLADPRDYAELHYLKRMKWMRQKEDAINKAINTVKQSKAVTHLTKDLQTAKKVQSLLDKTACFKDQLDISIKFINHSDCFSELNIEKTLFNYDMSLDWLYMVFVLGTQLTREERIKTIDDAIFMIDEYLKDGYAIINSVQGMLDTKLFEVETQPTNYIGFTRRPK